MCARLARIMQHNSYGPNQPEREPLNTRRARKKLGIANDTHTRARKVTGGRGEGGTTRNNWGGARNRKDRVSTALKQEHSEGILKAIALAELKGMVLNRFWTVNYEWAGIGDSDGAAFIGKLLAQCGRFARNQGGCFAAVWVREIGPKNGAHVHIALHLPLGWKLSGHHPRKWIKRAGGQYSTKVSDMRPIGGRLDCASTNPAHYWANAEAMANYMVKGSADTVAEELGLRLRKHGGLVVGKRWGRTQNLNQ